MDDVGHRLGLNRVQGPQDSREKGHKPRAVTVDVPQARRAEKVADGCVQNPARKKVDQQVDQVVNKQANKSVKVSCDNKWYVKSAVLHENAPY